ncbi:hypothetical protein GGS26DRAFT_531580 [Hypomontagnella submonticulosa]|nr:hypothetical protein GGS26DRAFT_531580 [Hypomontagnella submonticulosa]
MATFTCGHLLPKSRIGVNLAHIPREKGARCPECQTKSPVGTIALLKNTKKLGKRNPNVNLHVLTYVFDRFMSQRKDVDTGFKKQFANIISQWSETAFHMLDRKQLASFLITVRGRWGSEIVKQILRSLAMEALKVNDVYTPIEPRDAEILHTFNRMVSFTKSRAATMQNVEQLEIICNNAAILKKLRDDVTSALSKLEEGFAKWDANIHA